MKKTEQELREYAAEQAKTITIRTYNNGNSNDETRKATKPERKIIQSIIYGGLLAIRRGEDKQSVRHTCKFIGKLQIPEMNGYDTIYIPLGNFNFDE